MGDRRGDGWRCVRVELALSKLKAHLKSQEPGAVDDLWKAAGAVCDLFKPHEYANFFKKDGYDPA